MKPDYEEALRDNLEFYNDAIELANRLQRAAQKDEIMDIANIHKRLINEYRLKLSETDSLQKLYDERNELYYKYLNYNDTVLFYVVAFTYSCYDSIRSDTIFMDCNFILK